MRNIKNVTSSNNTGVGTTDDTGAIIPIGNYSHDYEVVQIPGRSINNKYFIENVGISTASTSPTFLPIRSNIDREVPDRGQNKYVLSASFLPPEVPKPWAQAFRL